MSDINPSVVHYRVRQSASGTFVERMVDSCTWVGVTCPELIELTMRSPSASAQFFGLGDSRRLADAPETATPEMLLAGATAYEEWYDRDCGSSQDLARDIYLAMRVAESTTDAAAREIMAPDIPVR